MVIAEEFVCKVYVPLLCGWGYIWGTAGVTWTWEKQEKINQTTDENRAMSRKYGAQWIGDKVTDCSGLILWALKQLGEAIAHHARYQYTDYSARKGRLAGGRREDGQPVLPGTAVFLQGSKDRIHHVGVYVGHGICIEAKGAMYGVVTSALDHWDHWGELKMVDYTDAGSIEDKPAPEILEREERQDVLFHAVVNNPGKWLNVRSGPGKKNSELFRLEKGDAVDVLAEYNGWDQVRFGSRVGWASAEYLKRTDEQPPEEPQEDDDGDKDAPIFLPDEDPQPPEDPQTDLSAAVYELRSIRARIDQVLRILGAN